MKEIKSGKDAESWWASLTIETKIEIAQNFIENDIFDDDEGE